VPTPQHVALLELIFAAVALRQHTEQDDRHAGFLIVGPTLGWKSSAAEFLALALGVDGASHITDMRTERGQSLWIRRSAAGEVLTRRDLLSAPIVVFGRTTRSRTTAAKRPRRSADSHPHRGSSIDRCGKARPRPERPRRRAA